MRPRAAKLSPSCPKFLVMICLPKSVIYLKKLNVLSDVFNKVRNYMEFNVKIYLDMLFPSP